MDTAVPALQLQVEQTSQAALQNRMILDHVLTA